MKCKYKEARNQCENICTYTCSICQPLISYCKIHSGYHFIDTNHPMLLIEKIDFKTVIQKIKYCINRIAEDSSAIIAEINRISLNTISQLKNSNKNVKDINKLKLYFYDPDRVSYLVKQASTINQSMINKPKEEIKNLLNQKKAIIENLNNEKGDILGTLNTKIQELKESQMSSHFPNETQCLNNQGTNLKGFNYLQLQDWKNYYDENWSIGKFDGDLQKILLADHNKHPHYCKI